MGFRFGEAAMAKDRPKNSSKPREHSVIVLDTRRKVCNNTTALRAQQLAKKNGRAVIIASSPDADQPVVIQLTDKTVNIVHNRHNRASKRGVIERDHSCCQYCGQKFTAAELTLDHVLPKSRGGKNTWENFVAACHKCNNKKADRTPEEAGMKLLCVPSRPEFVQIDGEQLMRSLHIEVNWEKHEIHLGYPEARKSNTASEIGGEAKKPDNSGNDSRDTAPPDDKSSAA
jgi:hypothetical protein